MRVHAGMYVFWCCLSVCCPLVFLCECVFVCVTTVCVRPSSVHRSINLTSCMYPCQVVGLCKQLTFVCLYVFLSVPKSVSLSVYLHICLSVSLSVVHIYKLPVINPYCTKQWGEEHPAYLHIWIDPIAKHHLDVIIEAIDPCNEITILKLKII